MTVHRILVVDDNPTIHEDFRKILAPSETAGAAEMDVLERALFGEPVVAAGPHYALDAAAQGHEALAMVERARADGHPYTMAFVDVRMPPGWDGVETIERLWAADPDLQAVICTAYSDYSWDDMVRRLGCTDRLLILKKPFDTIEVLQLAVAVTTKWGLARDVEQHIAHLQETLRRAEELAEMRARFVATVSHEFRTPLASIMAATDSLARYAERMSADERAERQGRIHREIRHLTDLLDDALAISRGGSDRFPCRPRPLDLVGLCHDVVEECRSTRATTADLVVEVELPDAEPALDPTLTRQILGNLVSNAIKYSPAGGTIRLRIDGDAEQVRMRISDQGIGISAADQQRLFEPYQRGANVGDIGGLGLGLAITRKAVESHRGTITIASVAGEGTTFEVTLPCSAPATGGAA